jgi:hypothetical protein
LQRPTRGIKASFVFDCCLRGVVSDLGYAVPGMVEKLPQLFVKLLVLDNAIVVLLHALALAHSDLIAGWKSEKKCQ